MKAWTLLLTWCVLALASVRAAESELRFSQSLTTAERQDAGLERLTSDQVAVLDALIRRDLTARLSGRGETAAPNFSQRLSEDERRNAGLASLPAAEVARVDALIERHTSSRITRALLAPPVYLSRAQLPEPVERKAERKIHGSISLSYGWGKGGYSEKTGAMTLRMDDPAGRYSIAVGYSETHIKGPGGTYRDDYYRRDPSLIATPAP